MARSSRISRAGGGTLTRQATASIYGAATRRAHDIAQEICDEIKKDAGTPDSRKTGTAKNRQGRLRHLRDSYYVDTDVNGDALVKTKAPYWKYVEFGTGHGKEQKHLRPAIEVVRGRHT